MWDWVFRALGVFWLVGGMATLWALRQARGLDAMLAALSGGVRQRDVVRAELLTLGAVLTVLAGLFLALLDRFAPAAFFANALVQAGWLLYAAREFPPEDDEDRIGRARSTNAFGVWLVGTGAVAAAERFDVVRFEALPVPEMIAGGMAVAVLVWQSRGIRAMRAMPTLDGPATGSPHPEEAGPFRQPVNVVLAPEVGCWPLWDGDDGRNLDPSRLEIPDDLRERIADFEGRVIEALDVDHDDGPTIVDRAAVARFEAEAIALTRALAAVYGPDAVAWRLPGEA